MDMVYMRCMHNRRKTVSAFLYITAVVTYERTGLMMIEERDQKMSIVLGGSAACSVRLSFLNSKSGWLVRNNMRFHQLVPICIAVRVAN
jgi:hypothetical protein